MYQADDGLWVATVEAGRVDGRRRRIKVKAKTKRAALVKIDEAKSRLRAGVPVPDLRRTTADYLRWWLADVAPGRIRASTLRSYEYSIGASWVPLIGSVPLAKLTPQHIVTAMRKMETGGWEQPFTFGNGKSRIAKPVSPSTIARHRAVLQRALGDALRFELVTRNAALAATAPRNSHPVTVDALTAEEARKVLATLNGDRWQALAELALTIGCRMGEALALRWSDVDFDAQALTIAGTLQRLKGGGWEITEPKTAAGRRVVPMSPRLAALLREHRRSQLEQQLAAPLWADQDFVFTTDIGTPLEASKVRRWWRSATERAGIGARRFHATRHTAATLAVEAGAPIELVSRVLGHARLSITADIYTHPRPEALRGAVEAVSGALSGEPNGSQAVVREPNGSQTQR